MEPGRNPGLSEHYTKLSSFLYVPPVLNFESWERPFDMNYDRLF